MNVFTNLDHCSSANSDSGKAFVAAATQGEATLHKGYVSDTEAKLRAKKL
ncbi:MAG: hypothetical protein ACRBB0_13955 [Pelagimonas sp.]